MPLYYESIKKSNILVRSELFLCPVSRSSITDTSTSVFLKLYSCWQSVLIVTLCDVLNRPLRICFTNWIQVRQWKNKQNLRLKVLGGQTHSYLEMTTKQNLCARPVWDSAVNYTLGFRFIRWSRIPRMTVLGHGVFQRWWCFGDKTLTNMTNTLHCFSLPVVVSNTLTTQGEEWIILACNFRLQPISVGKSNIGSLK